jgi:hypothetical protein
LAQNHTQNEGFYQELEQLRKKMKGGGVSDAKCRRPLAVLLVPGLLRVET